MKKIILLLPAILLTLAFSIPASAGAAKFKPTTSVGAGIVCAKKIHVLVSLSPREGRVTGVSVAGFRARARGTGWVSLISRSKFRKQKRISLRGTIRYRTNGSTFRVRLSERVKVYPFCAE